MQKSTSPKTKSSQLGACNCAIQLLVTRPLGATCQLSGAGLYICNAHTGGEDDILFIHNLQVPRCGIRNPHCLALSLAFFCLVWDGPINMRSYKGSPIEKRSPLFGHCPNIDSTPRPSLKRAAVYILADLS